MVITLTKITAVSIAPNPVDAGAQYQISVTVTEETVTVSATPFAAAEIAAGEV